MSGVSVEKVGRAMQALLERDQREIAFRDGTGQQHVVSAATAASPSGLLPALVIAGEAIWREATGLGFSLDIQPDRSAVTGYRLAGIGSASFTVVMLTMMEATTQVAGPRAIVVQDLNAVWSAATDRIQRAVHASASGVSP